MHGGTLGVVFMGLLAACAEKASDTPDAQPPPLQVGDLGAAIFKYNCGPNSDPQCNVNSELAPIAASSQFPILALGSTFQLTATAADGGASLNVIPVSTSFLGKDATGNLQTAKRVGVTSVFADQGSNLLDLTTVVVGQPDHMKILQATPQGSFKDGSITIGPGGVTATQNVTFTFTFRAFMVDKSDQILAGAFPCNWTSSDGAIANVTSPPGNNIATVVSGKAGKAVVTVTLGTFPPSTIDIAVN